MGAADLTRLTFPEPPQEKAPGLVQRLRALEARGHIVSFSIRFQPEILAVCPSHVCHVLRAKLR